MWSRRRAATTRRGRLRARPADAADAGDDREDDAQGWPGPFARGTACRPVSVRAPSNDAIAALERLLAEVDRARRVRRAFVYPRAFRCRLTTPAGSRTPDAHGILHQADEVQSGVGTGRPWAVEHYGPAPTCPRRQVARRLPLASVTGRAELMDAPAPWLGGTFGGNPVACATLATPRRARRSPPDTPALDTHA
jgi:hypothetical protein